MSDSSCTWSVRILLSSDPQGTNNAVGVRAFPLQLEKGKIMLKNHQLSPSTPLVISQSPSHQYAHYFPHHGKPVSPKQPGLSVHFSLRDPTNMQQFMFLSKLECGGKQSLDFLHTNDWNVYI